MSVTRKLSEFLNIIGAIDALQARIEALDIADDRTDSITEGFCEIGEAMTKRLAWLPACSPADVVCKLKRLGWAHREEKGELCIDDQSNDLLAGMLADIEQPWILSA